MVQEAYHQNILLKNTKIENTSNKQMILNTQMIYFLNLSAT